MRYYAIYGRAAPENLTGYAELVGSDKYVIIDGRFSREHAFQVAKEKCTGVRVAFKLYYASALRYVPDADKDIGMVWNVPSRMEWRQA